MRVPEPVGLGDWKRDLRKLSFRDAHQSSGSSEGLAGRNGRMFASFLIENYVRCIDWREQGASALVLASSKVRRLRTILSGLFISLENAG